MLIIILPAHFVMKRVYLFDNKLTTKINVFKFSK